MPGLLRGGAGTAVVAGTASAVSNRVSCRQGRRWAAHGQEWPHDWTPPAPPTGEADRISPLKEPASLQAQGNLTPQEFDAEKARVLRS